MALPAPADTFVDPKLTYTALAVPMTGLADPVRVFEADEKASPACLSLMIAGDPANGSIVIYVGDSQVTTATGIPIDAYTSISFPIDKAKKLYAIADAEGSKLRRMRVATEVLVTKGASAAALAILATEATAASIDAKMEGPWSAYRSVAREKTAIVKATGGTLKGFTLSMLSTAPIPLFVQVHDAAGATALSNDTFVMPLGPINPGDVIPYDLDGAMICADGIKLALSSTEDSYTVPGTDDGWWLAKMA